MKGVLTSNLGSPEGPTPEQLAPYLKEFLMDPLVIDLPYFLRWPLVNWAIIPKRKVASASLYKNIWTPEGSPLLVHTRELARKVAKRLGSEYLVEVGMRYGRPSLREALLNFKRTGVESIVISPQYPQYALSSYESTCARVWEIARELRCAEKIKFVPVFYNTPEFLNAAEAILRSYLDDQKFDHLLFSFHGLPERHVKKTESAKGHCLGTESCCDRITGANGNCYRAQSYWTARELASRLKLNENFYSIGFQSRLTKRWIQPFSDELIAELAEKGVKRLAVVCPSFTADCLETVEEVGIRFQNSFRKAGGENVTLVPCVNSTDLWADGLTQLIKKAEAL